MCAESELSDDDFFEEGKSDQKPVKTTLLAEREISLAPGRLDELKYEVILPDGTIVILSLNALQTVEDIQKLLWARESYKYPQTYWDLWYKGLKLEGKMTLGEQCVKRGDQLMVGFQREKQR